MDIETYELRGGTIVYKSRPPLDVRIVAYLVYVCAFLQLGVGLLLATGVAKPVDASWPILCGAIVLTSKGALVACQFSLGVCTLFEAWGLMRRMKFAWWLLLASTIYAMAEAVSHLAKYPVSAGIGIATGLPFFAWLWFRRELYGVHLGAKRTAKQ